MVGGSTIISSNIWATKVSETARDTSGYGTYSVTTFQDKYNKKLSIIVAYIGVKKGSDIGIESLYAQQVTLYKRECKRQGISPSSRFCPHAHAIKRLDALIQDLQQCHHAIILLLDANQALSECFAHAKVKPYSIEWLRFQRGVDDPFVQLHGQRPNFTTINPNRDIDYILTFGINATHVSTLPINTPTLSNHLGMIIDFDMASHFASTYSALAIMPHQSLSSGNKRSVDAYLDFVHDQIGIHKIWERTNELLLVAQSDPSSFTDLHKESLNTLDSQLTEIMLAGERICSKNHTE